MKFMKWFHAAALVMAVAGCTVMQGDIDPDTRAALAPTGKLRVAFLAAPIYATKDPATGELKGVAVDLGRELAQRLGVPFEPVPHSGVPAIIAGAKAGSWDVVLMGINAERAAVMDFSAPYMEVEQGYLVRAGAPIASAADVDRPGIRVGVIEKAGADVLLSKELRNATLIRAKTVPELYALIAGEKADVIAATKSTLFAGAPKYPGSRVLDGRILVEPLGMAVPKGRPSTAAAYVRKFVEDAKAQGLVKSAIERAGLRGVTVAARG